MQLQSILGSINDSAKGGVEITWRVGDKESGALRAVVTMKAGDVACMPADIRHKEFAPKRSMLLVSENLTPGLERRYVGGELQPVPAEF